MTAGVGWQTLWMTAGVGMTDTVNDGGCWMTESVNNSGCWMTDTVDDGGCWNERLLHCDKDPVVQVRIRRITEIGKDPASTLLTQG